MSRFNNEELKIMELGEQYHTAYKKLYDLYKQINEIIGKNKNVFGGELKSIHNCNFTNDSFTVVHSVLHYVGARTYGVDTKDINKLYEENELDNAIDTKVYRKERDK